MREADKIAEELAKPLQFLPWNPQKIELLPVSMDDQADLLMKKAERIKKISTWKKGVETEDLAEIERKIFETKRKNAEIQQKIELKRAGFLKMQKIEQQATQVQFDDDEGIELDCDDYQEFIVANFNAEWDAALPEEF